jgi:DNA-binding Lrp family transcriptional regulator
MNAYIKVNTEFFNTNLDPLSILILALIESYARDNKEFYQTNEQLSKMFNVSMTYVKNTLNELEKKNYIKRATKTVRDLDTMKFSKRRTISLVHLPVEKKFEFSF